MFHKISEEEYLNLLTFTKGIYDAAMRSDAIKTPYICNRISQNANYRHSTIISICKKYHNHFNNKPMELLFKINLLINENERFAHAFYIYCYNYLKARDINRINSIFLTRDTEKNDKMEYAI